MPLSYSVQLHRNGAVVFCATVPAREAGLVGDYHNGKPHQPDNAALRAAIPFRYRKAFDRTMTWWQTTPSGRNVPLKCTLRSVKGCALGELFATPQWSAA